MPQRIIYRDARNIQRETTIFEFKEFVSVYTPGAKLQPVLVNSTGKIDPSLIDIAPANMLKLTRKAQTTVAVGDAVYAVSTTHVAPATNDLTYKEALVFGISMNAGQAGDSIDIAILGAVQNMVFGVFEVNSILYLDSQGGLTDERPSNGLYLMPVAKGLGNATIMVQIGLPTKTTAD